MLVHVLQLCFVFGKLKFLDSFSLYLRGIILKTSFGDFWQKMLNALEYEEQEKGFNAFYTLKNNLL